jgi:hypothetical protein
MYNLTSLLFLVLACIIFTSCYAELEGKVDEVDANEYVRSVIAKESDLHADKNIYTLSMSDVNPKLRAEVSQQRRRLQTTPTPPPTSEPTDAPQSNPTQSPTISFRPTAAPVPTFRPTANPTPAPTGFNFPGSAGSKYVIMTMIFNVQLRKTTFYKDYNLPTLTTSLIATVMEIFFNFNDASMNFDSLEFLQESELSWTLNLYYDLYFPLTSNQYIGYDAKPINLFKEMVANYSAYHPNVKTCCVPDTVDTEYNTLGSELNYNNSIARQFFFQNFRFTDPRGQLIVQTESPTASPTNTPAPSNSPAPTGSPVVPSSAVSSGGGGKVVVNTFVVLIIAVAGGGVLIAAFVYYLYATKQYCFKIFDKDEEGDEEDDEEDLAAADATFVKPPEKEMVMGPNGVMVEAVSADAHHRRRNSKTLEVWRKSLQCYD